MKMEDIMEKKMCERCKEHEVMEGYPICHECFTKTKQWGTNAEKQRVQYYAMKERMEQDPEYAMLIRARRKEASRKWKEANREHFKAYQKKYKQEHREHWNAYQREYNRRKRNEIIALKAELAELKKQMATSQGLTNN